MNIESNGRFQHITPSEGMILTDGETYSSSVYLPMTADISRWSEVRNEVVNMTAADVAELVDAWNNKERIAARLDELGKVVQTAQGSGTEFDPYKVWKVGMSVVEGDWWMTQDGYLWQAKKSGVPASSTDAEYWNIVE